MKTLQTGLTAAALAAAFAATSIVPAAAAPIFIQKTVTAQSDVVQVRHRRWAPAAGAFVAGALIGGAIASSNRGYYRDGYYVDRYPSYYYDPYYSRAPVYYPPRSSYSAGYRDGYRDGYYAGSGYNDITCTPRLQDAGKC